MTLRPTARSLSRAALTLALPALAACDVTTEADQDTFYVSFAVDPVPAGAITVTGGGNTLVIDDVSFVVDDAGLAYFNTDLGCVDGPSSECFPVTDTPALVTLPIGEAAAVVTPFQLRGPERLYETFEFDVHTPDAADPEDDALLAQHPTYDGVGLRVAGTWNGTAFELARPLDARMLVEFGDVFPGDENWNLTVAAAVEEWFLSGGATPVPFDPATAVPGGANDATFVGNVVASFTAFPDFDRDGANDFAAAAPE
jgi:hypothetical protein